MAVVLWDMEQGVICSQEPQNFNSENSEVNHYFIWNLDEFTADT